MMMMMVIIITAIGCHPVAVVILHVYTYSSLTLEAFRCVRLVLVLSLGSGMQLGLNCRQLHIRKKFYEKQ